MKYVLTPLGSSGYIVDELGFYDKRTALEEQEVRARWDARRQRRRQAAAVPASNSNPVKKI